MSDRDGGSTQGMTMRQYYKAAALQGMLAAPYRSCYFNDENGSEVVCETGEQLAIAAGQFADAMLAEDMAFERIEK